MPTIYFQHFTYEPANAAAFYETLGRVVVLWGRLEAVIDTTLLHILAHPEAMFQPPKEMPLAFKLKMQLWNRVFNQEPLVARFQKRALQFAKMAKPISDKRNYLIHAAIGEFNPERPDHVIAEVLKPKGPDTMLHTFKLMQSELDELANEIVRLHGMINPIATVSYIRSAAAARRDAQSEDPQA